MMVIIIIIINIIILCVSFKHVKRCKFKFVTFDITRKNYLYWILNVEIHLDARGLDDTIKERNKTFEQLICSCENDNVKKKISQILWIYFMSLY